MSLFSEADIKQLALDFNQLVEGMFQATISRKSFGPGSGIEKPITETVVYEDLWCDYQNVGQASAYTQGLLGTGGDVERKVFLPRFKIELGNWEKIVIKVDDLVQIKEADGTLVGKFKIVRLDPYEDHQEAVIDEAT